MSMNAKFWFAALLLGALGTVTASAEIFRTVDEHGNVVFTDIPPPGNQASESVTVNPVNTFSVPTPAATAPPPEADVPEVAHYESLTIVAPANDATVRENAGNVTVAVALDPPLRAGDRLVLYMDGDESPVPARGSSFQLENVDRGTHTIGVRVIDGAGRVAAEAPTSRFHLQRVIVPRPTPA
ncbi:MAG: DUF4124 domain-containing protein [Chloroflexi bacterium]|nr:MAG: DUF4124 domain-containing protein [Chloroflexota bacterium]